MNLYGNSINATFTRAALSKLRQPRGHSRVAQFRIPTMEQDQGARYSTSAPGARIDSWPTTRLFSAAPVWTAEVNL